MTATNLMRPESHASGHCIAALAKLI